MRKELTIIDFLTDPRIPKRELYKHFHGEMIKEILPPLLFYCRGNQLHVSKILGINRNTLRKILRENFGQETVSGNRALEKYKKICLERGISEDVFKTERKKKL
jgi:hypothetical protein